MTAAYDEIADWYEAEFLANLRLPPDTPGRDPIGVDRALREGGAPTPMVLAVRARRP